MVVGTLALTGFPLTAGYFSKDAIIEAANASKNPAAFYGYLMTLLAAGLTSFYSWRLVLKTFHGRPHDEAHFEAAHESPRSMLIPLFVLAVGAILAGMPFYNIFAGAGIENFFRDSLKLNTELIETMHHESNVWIASLPTVAMAIGFGDRVAVLHPPPRHPGRARAPAAGALPVPAQQVVLRRDLRLPHRSPDAVARPPAVEGR